MQHPDDDYSAAQAALETLEALEHPARRLWASCPAILVCGLLGGLVAALILALLLGLWR